MTSVVLTLWTMRVKSLPMALQASNRFSMSIHGTRFQNTHTNSFSIQAVNNLLNGSGNARSKLSIVGKQRNKIDPLKTTEPPPELSSVLHSPNVNPSTSPFPPISHFNSPMRARSNELEPLSNGHASTNLKEGCAKCLKFFVWET